MPMMEPNIRVIHPDQPKNKCRRGADNRADEQLAPDITAKGLVDITKKTDSACPPFPGG